MSFSVMTLFPNCFCHFLCEIVKKHKSWIEISMGFLHCVMFRCLDQVFLIYVSNISYFLEYYACSLMSFFCFKCSYYWREQANRWVHNFLKFKRFKYFHFWNWGPLLKDYIIPHPLFKGANYSRGCIIQGNMRAFCVKVGTAVIFSNPKLHNHARNFKGFHLQGS